MAKKKYYAVAKGRSTGIFETWSECQAQTQGFSKSKFKSFRTKAEGEAYLAKEGVAVSSSSSLKRNKSTEEEKSVAEEPKTKKRRSSCDAEEDTLPVPANATATDRSKIVIVIFFDGGARGNPGVAGAGAVLEVIKVSPTGDKTGHRCFVRHFVGYNATNNVAEYEGFLHGMSKAKKEITSFVSNADCGATAATAEVKVYGDSNLVIQQLEGKFKCKSPNIRKLYEKGVALIQELKAMDSIRVQLKMNHVAREANSMADGLANEAMDQRRSWKTFQQTSIGTPCTANNATTSTAFV